MRTKVTKKWLESQEPCSEGLEYWIEQKKPDLFYFIRQCIKDDHCEWANWLMVRCMDFEQYLKYAMYAVKRAEPMYRKQYPDSTVITDAIKAVKACIRDDSAENRRIVSGAYKAADNAIDVATYAAANGADTVYYAAAAAVSAATAMALSAFMRSADAAADSVDNSTDSIADGNYSDADNACKEMHTKLFSYGMRIMKEKQKCARK